MIVKLKKKDTNPIGDMDEILQTAKKKLNGSVKTGLRVSFEQDKDEVLIKIMPE